MKAEKVFAKKINERFSKKQNEMKRLPAQMGGGDGSLRVTGLNNFVYVTIADKTLPAFNNRVPPKKGLRVWVGYSPEEPNLFQVLSTRSDAPAGDVDTTIGGYAPAIRYEWLARYGGEDPLNVHLRAFTPLKLGISSAGGLNVNLFNGYVYSGGYIHVARQDIDMTAHVPSTSGKCALVLVTINTSGTVVSTKGSEVNIADLVVTDLPAIPSSTVFVCGAVRVYNGQTVFQERKTNTDFVDLRFAGLAGGAIVLPSHNTLGGLQGGTSSQYYHLTSAQHSGLVNSSGTTLHFHAHNNMSDMQGGTSGEYYHLTSAQYLVLANDIQLKKRIWFLC